MGQVNSVRHLLSVDGLVQDMEIYHPLPYPELEPINRLSWRKDSINRYECVKDSYGPFNGKTLIDIGCANGYFLFKFMLDGGIKAVGVDTNDKYLRFINYVAEDKCVDVSASENLPDMKFDIGIYLDLYHPDNRSLDGHCDYIGNHCDTAFVSSCITDGSDPQELLDNMARYYSDIKQIYQGFAKRKIFICRNNNVHKV